MALLVPPASLTVLAPAYIGPGAGFALGGSFLFALAGIGLAAVALLAWPVRVVVRMIRARRRPGRAKARRVVTLGLDGLDPILARKWMDAGQMPNLARLKAEGGFRPLGTTWPAMSPVGWSTFATGVDPSGHNIFDFLNRDMVTHLPILSSTRLKTHSTRSHLERVPLPGCDHPFELLRRSKPFCTTCGEQGVASSVLRIPITFPPDRFAGRQLSAMCLPDLRGTQGTFTHFSAPGEDPAGRTTGGDRRTLEAAGPDTWRGELPGPDRSHGSGVQTVAVTVKVDASARRAEFELDGNRFTLGEHEYSEWIPLCFCEGRRRAYGICKVRVTRFEAPFAFYVSPVNIDPLHPAFPISQPAHFSLALARLHGRFATLGLAEDTWALNERVIDEQAFLDQAWANHAERERQLFHALDHQPDGVISVVFDATDRIQHMFFRYLEPDHPANAGKDTERHKDAIAQLYTRADDLVGRVLAKLGPRDVLLVVSDHGFKSFRRGVNLNAWFRRNGYLYLKSDPVFGPLPQIPVGTRYEATDVDWTRTRAYTNGLAGFYLNIAGRERNGCVPPEEALALKREIIDQLRGLPDPAGGGEAVTELWAGEDIYPGPYRENGPDVIVGYKPGYRTDWDAAVGAVTDLIVSDNTRSWSGDHCMDPRQVPGVLFSNRSFAATRPDLRDIAPSVLDLLGLPVPRHMTGRSIFAPEPEQAP